MARAFLSAQPVVATFTLAKISHSRTLGISRSKVSSRPPAGRAYEHVVRNLEARKTTLQHSRRSLTLGLEGAILGPPSRNKKVVGPDAYQVVSEIEIDNLLAVHAHANNKQRESRKPCDVIDAYIAQRGRSGSDLKQSTQAAVCLSINVVEDNVVNTIATTSARRSARVRNSGAHHHAVRRVADMAETNGHIRSPAKRALIILILRREQNGESRLREPTPDIFENIVFEQNSLRILELEQILHNKRFPRRSPHEPLASQFPDQRLEKMIAPNLDIRRRTRRLPPAKHDVFAGGFEKVIDDLVRAHRAAAQTTRNSLGVKARSSHRYAMKIAEV